MIQIGKHYRVRGIYSNHSVEVQIHSITDKVVRVIRSDGKLVEVDRKRFESFRIKEVENVG